jgi:hypothetical protein
MRNAENSAGERLAAARFLADRGWGTAPQLVEVNISAGPSLDPTRLSDEELDAFVQLAERATLRGSVEPGASPPLPLRAIPPDTDDHEPPEAA